MTPVVPMSDLHAFSLGRDVDWLWSLRASRFGDKPFLIYDAGQRNRRTYSYAEFEAQAGRCAGALAGLGVTAGAYVLLHMENRPEFLISFFALQRLGAIAVTTNVHSAPGELRYFAEHSGASFAVTEAGLLPALAQSGVRFSGCLCVDAPPGSGTDDFASLVANAPYVERRTARNADDAAVVQYTSGTTARPKGVVLTQANLLWSASRNAAHCALGPMDVALCFLPLFHTNALGYSMLATLWSGSTLVLMPKWSASRFWEVATRNRATWTSVGPFVTLGLKDQPVPDHSFRFWGSITGHDPEIERLFGIPTLGWWGMTETVSHPILSDLSLPNSPRAMGWPTPEYNVRVVDENNVQVGPGTTGRLQILGRRGLSMFAKYLNDPEATARSFDAAGWFDTGDRVELLDDGSIAFVDRDKDMMKVGGENVAASEVEAIVNSVAGVIESAVVGERHEFLHEVPVAFVVATGDRSEIERLVLAACARELARFKVPRRVEFLEALPRLPIGKMDKKALRAALNPPKP